MKIIPLTQGKFVMVDDDDFKYLNKFKWYAKKSNQTFYAVMKSSRKLGKQINIFMHNLIMKTPANMLTDHIDHNGLNCQKNNLRICDTLQNSYNKNKRKNTSSKYKGVTYDTKRKKWRMQIRFSNKYCITRRFKNEKDAMLYYNEMAIKYHGDFASLN